LTAPGTNLDCEHARTNLRIWYLCGFILVSVRVCTDCLQMWELKPFPLYWITGGPRKAAAPAR
jgi:hypothetical protein